MGEGNVPGLQDKMYMVGHKAECMNPITETACSFLKQEAETVPVVIGEENWLAAVAAEDDMVKSTWDVYACFSCHGDRIALYFQLVNLEA
ncbi:MAG: hypothetical protein FD174_3933 [Geobacteraceae bacterium]|nr:MAG: hypothetical protein FD174_3933 [Geobacteraceae bacterium]